jgi:hypothetical protein
VTSQPKPDLPPAPPSAPTFPSPTVVVPSTPPAPTPEKSVEQLLADLERVQAEKAALEKKEQELKTTIRKKLDQQTERLKKLGVGPAVPPDLTRY